MHQMQEFQISEGIAKYMDEIKRPITKDRVPQLIVALLEKIASMDPSYRTAGTADVQFWFARELHRASSDDAEKSILLFICGGIRAALYAEAGLRSISKAEA